MIEGQEPRTNDIACLEIQLCLGIVIACVLWLLLGQKGIYANPAVAAAASGPVDVLVVAAVVVGDVSGSTGRLADCGGGGRSRGRLVVDAAGRGRREGRFPAAVAIAVS